MEQDKEEKAALPPHSCRGCTKRWWGLAMAHCPTCHETFSTVGNFDAHRKDGKCHNPARVKPAQRLDDRGVWVRDEVRELVLA